MDRKAARKLAADECESLPNLLDANSSLWTTSGGQIARALKGRFLV
jgi:hypothetical protein